MTASPATSPGTAPSRVAPPTPVRRERLVGLGITVAGIAVVTAASQVHHHVAPTQAGGWRELPTYVIAGAIGWLVSFGIAYIGPHRAASPATVSRRVGLGLAVVGLPAAALLWWSPIPMCLGAAAVLLVRRAREFGTTSRWDVLTLLLATVAIALPIAVLAYRIVQLAS